MKPDHLEALGMSLVLLAVLAGITATWALAGWPWALVTLAVASGAVGVVLIRTAALTLPGKSEPEPEPEKDGESA